MTLKSRRYCKLKEEAPARILLRTRFGRGYGPVARQCDMMMMMMMMTTTVMMVCDYFQPRIVKNALGEGYFVWRTHSRHFNFLYLTTLSACLLEKPSST
jgi:hypothetical protein